VMTVQEVLEQALEPAVKATHDVAHA
jgi:hypothetical protein